MTTDTVTYIGFHLLTRELGNPCEACDFHHNEWCSKKQAEWIGRARCPGCQASRVYLLCPDCKDLMGATQDALECGTCGEITAPARHMWTLFEPINKRSAG